ncbi:MULTISPECIES: FAD-dependent monooxygenase [Sorangium]|uniref:FAD-dependent monooxygenase n=1 Tax=Sorangium TaxID=39643 RepID=UPI003D9C4B2A
MNHQGLLLEGEADHVVDDRPAPPRRGARGEPAVPQRGGPVGMLLASELALAKVRVRLLEKRRTRTEQSRALTVHPRSLEILDQCGILDRFQRRGMPVPFAHFAWLDTPLDFSRLDTTRLSDLRSALEAWCGPA